MRAPRSESDRRFGPWRFRQFSRWFDKHFLRFILMLWFGGIGIMLLVSLFHLDQQLGVRVDRVALFTIWPAIVAWMGLSGVGILWKLRLLFPKRVEHASYLGRALYSVWLLTGVMFVAGAVWLVIVVVRGANGV